MKLEFNQENIAQLEKENAAPCVSIYLPLSKTTREKSSDNVRFENLLKTAARQIIQGGGDKNFARQLVEPGFALTRDHFFWKTGAVSLAIFIAPPQILRYFEVPATIKESVYAGKGFDLARLQKKLDDRRDFYLLAASKNNLALYQNKNDVFKKLTVAGLPENIKELTPDKTFEKKLQSHGGAPAGRSELFHGQGQGKETEKVLVLKYFQIANDALRAVLANGDEPLVFAGSPNLYPIFRKANTYPYLFKIALQGNFDETPPAELQKKALSLLS
jgi:Bacterial archaeo-eukaryotic release factor family 7